MHAFRERERERERVGNLLIDLKREMPIAKSSASGVRNPDIKPLIS
jgi:hypothetical protein